MSLWTVCSTLVRWSLRFGRCSERLDPDNSIQKTATHYIMFTLAHLIFKWKKKKNQTPPWLKDEKKKIWMLEKSSGGVNNNVASMRESMLKTHGVILDYKHRNDKRWMKLSCLKNETNMKVRWTCSHQQLKLLIAINDHIEVYGKKALCSVNT